MDFFLKTIHFIKYFKVHLRIKNRDFYHLDFDTGKKIEEVQILGIQRRPPKKMALFYPWMKFKIFLGQMTSFEVHTMKVPLCDFIQSVPRAPSMCLFMWIKVDK